MTVERTNRDLAVALRDAADILHQTVTGDLHSKVRHAADILDAVDLQLPGVTLTQLVRLWHLVYDETAWNPTVARLYLFDPIVNAAIETLRQEAKR